MKKKILAYFLYYSGIFWLKLLWMKIIGSRNLRILCYHRVANIDSENFVFDEDLIDSSPKIFEKQIRFISKHFNVISFSDLLNNMIPKNPLIITFDDGYKDNYKIAFPVLKKYGLKATIFLVTSAIDRKNILWWDRVAYMIKNTNLKECKLQLNDCVYNFDISNHDKKRQAIREIIKMLKGIDNALKDKIIQELEQSLKVRIDKALFYKQYLTWEEIKDMEKFGIEFGSHSCTHPILENISYTEMRKELLNSKKRIETILNQPCIVFSYPNGNYNVLVKDAVKDCGYKLACSYDYGVNSQDSDPLAFKRISTHIGLNPLIFLMNLIFPKLMGMGKNMKNRDSRSYDKSRWYIYKPDKKSLSYFLYLNQNFSKKLRLSKSILPFPWVGSLFARYLSKKHILFLNSENNPSHACSVENLILELDRLLKHELQIPNRVQASFLVSEGKRGIRFFIFTKNRDFFLKFIKHKDLVYMLHNEYNNLQYLYFHLNGDILKTLPEECSLKFINGNPVLISKLIEGINMSEILHISSPSMDYVNGIKKQIRIAISWLIDFHRQTEKKRMNISSLEPHFSRLLEKYSKIFPDHNFIVSFFETLFDNIIKYKDLFLSFTCTHGDFFPNNIIISGRTIKIVDWTDMTTEDISLNDLFSFFLSYRVEKKKEKEDFITESLRFSFFERNWFSNIVSDSINLYCNKLNIDPQIVSFYFAIYLLKNALKEAEGVFSRKLITPQNWIGRLKYFVKNHDKFILNPKSYNFCRKGSRI